MHDTVNPAGQYTHGPARPSTASRSVLKLGDYVDHVKASEERTERLNKLKMSFDQWWKTASFPWMDSVPKHWFEAVWNAAQENK